MESEFYNLTSEIENKHWWFIARRKLIASVFEKLNIKNFGKCIDIGCGIGGNLTFLNKYCSNVIGLDYSDTAIELARQKYPEHHFMQGDANELTSLFTEEVFNLVTLFNVMYHKWIRNDNDVIRQIYSILKPDGYIVLTEPAFQHLWRYHDVIDMGKKRYRIEELRDILESVGFKIKVSTYFNSVSYLPALILALMYKLQKKKSRNINSPKKVVEVEIPFCLLNNIMSGLMYAERMLIRICKKLPIGVSLLLVAQKSKD